MRKTQKRAVMAYTWFAVAIFGLITYFLPLWTMPVDANTSEITSSQLVQDVHGFFTDIKTNIDGNVALISFIVGAIALGYYFLVYKPKTRRSR